MTEDMNKDVPGKTTALNRVTNIPGNTSAQPASRAVRKGVLPRHAVRMTSFAVISLTIFASGVLCLMAVWDFAAGDVAWRALASLGILAGTMAAFTVCNEVFGERQTAAHD